MQPLQVKDDKFDDYSDPNWAPEPIDAAPGQSSSTREVLPPLSCAVADFPCAGYVAEFRSGKASDIVSTLVSIYDSQDVIVKELQNLLAQKLLAVRDYDLEKEVRPDTLVALVDR